MYHARHPETFARVCRTRWRNLFVLEIEKLFHRDSNTRNGARLCTSQIEA